MTVEVSDWHWEARPAFAAALAAVNHISSPHDPVLETDSEEAMRSQDPVRLAGARDYLNASMHVGEVDRLV